MFVCKIVGIFVGIELRCTAVNPDGLFVGEIKSIFEGINVGNVENNGGSNTDWNSDWNDGILAWGTVGYGGVFVAFIVGCDVVAVAFGGAILYVFDKHNIDEDVNASVRTDY